VRQSTNALEGQNKGDKIMLNNPHFKRAPAFVKLGKLDKEIIASNKIRLIEINNEIDRLYKFGLDTAGFHRRELNKERRELQKQNADIRKGFITYGNGS